MSDPRAAFPLTLRYLGHAGKAADTPEAFVRAICDDHARGDIACRAVRDLVRYESLLLELRDLPARGPDGAAPGEDAKCVISPHVRVLVFGADLPGMLDALRSDKRATPRPRRGWLVLWRDGQMRLEREEGWMLERFREPAVVADCLEDDEDRASFERFWDAGLLSRV